MTQLTNPATHNHPNFVRTQTALDAIRQGDYWPFFEGAAREVIVENGPGAGPWHITHGKDDLARMFIEFGAAFDNNYERLPAHHETYVYWAMIIVMTRRLARQPATARTHARPV